MHFFFAFLLSLFFLSQSGCAIKEALFSPSEADKNFQKTLKEEFNYEVVLKNTGETLWIYFPQEEAIYALKQSSSAEEPAKRRLSLLYLDGSFDDQIFSFEYDIVPTTKTTKAGGGLANSYTDQFNTIYLNLMNTIGRIYLNSAVPPKFLVLVIADIKSGFEIAWTIYLEDFKKYQLGALPYEEYAVRILTDSKADAAITGDVSGNHLSYQNIAWPDFLTKQALNRIRFKYQQSNSQPTMDSEKEIVKAFAQTIQSYGYNDYQKIQLHDLRFDSRYEYNPSQVDQIAKDAEF